jgi:homoserine O-acetyltransferase
VTALRSRHGDVTYVEVNSTYGHDAFLVEYDEQTRLIKSFIGEDPCGLTTTRLSE